MSPRTVDKLARRSELVTAARQVLADRGVTATSVADIVRAAGVAQGTFYLYFETKDDVIAAVVDEVAEEVMAGLENSVGASGGTAEERLRAFGTLLSALAEDSSLVDVASFVHRPENETLHTRFAEQLLARMVPLIEAIVVQGVAEGTFEVEDAHLAAWFVLGGFRGLELAGTPLERMPDALETAIDLALRALGGGRR